MVGHTLLELLTVITLPKVSQYDQRKDQDHDDPVEKYNYKKQMIFSCYILHIGYSIILG